MGGKAGKILPLVAIAAAAALTAGAGAGVGLTAGEAGAGVVAGEAVGASTVATSTPGWEATLAQLTTQQAASPWYTQAFNFMASNKDVIGLGFSGLSAATGAMASSQQAQFQENSIKLQEAQDSLALAEKERDSQKKLQTVLAQQNNFLAAVGVNAGEGSAIKAAEGAKEQANREISLYGTQRELMNQSYAYRKRRAGSSRRNAGPAALLDFGVNAYKVMS